MLRIGVTLRQLEYFVATVDLGTFSAAAARYHISQSAVSLAISELERALEVQVLLRRPAQGPVLTAAGREVLADARRLLAHASELQSSARSIGGTTRGRLVVGSFPTITPNLMGRILSELPRTHPDLVLEFVEDTVDGLQDKLADGTCEVSLMYDLGIRSAMTKTALYACPPYVVLAADHPLASRPSVRLAEIVTEPMIMIDMPPSAEYFGGLIERAGLRPQIRFRSRSVETVRSLVGRHLGWSLLLHRPATDETYDGHAVVGVPLADPADAVDVVLVQSAEARPTKRTEAFVRFCIEHLRRPSVVRPRDAAERSPATRGRSS